MPIYEYQCAVCKSVETSLVSYEERNTPVSCECGGTARFIMSAPAFKPSIGGAHRRQAIAPDVGPLSKTTKAYQKKQDDENSSFYGPGQHGSMTSAQRKTFKQTDIEMKQGKSDFTK